MTIGKLQADVCIILEGAYPMWQAGVLSVDA